MNKKQFDGIMLIAIVLFFGSGSVYGSHDYFWPFWGTVTALSLITTGFIMIFKKL